MLDPDQSSTILKRLSYLDERINKVQEVYKQAVLKQKPHYLKGRLVFLLKKLMRFRQLYTQALDAQDLNKNIENN